MSRSDLLAYGTTFVGVAIGFLFGGPICGFVLLVIGGIFIAIAHLKKDGDDSASSLSVNQPLSEPSIEEQLRFEELKRRQQVRIDREIQAEEARQKQIEYVDGLAKQLRGFISKMNEAPALGQINMAWLPYGEWLNRTGLMSLGGNLKRYQAAHAKFERFELRDPTVLTTGRATLIAVMEATEFPPREIAG